jgi:adenine/guanine/hypoxanthine permease
MNSAPRKLIDQGDLDGFFGLFVDNLVQLLLIVALCEYAGIKADSILLIGYILPGAAISILAGNLFYSWQARRLARKENRGDVTALPYGINTPSLIVFVFFVMVPAFHQQQGIIGEEAAARFAWQMGLIACLGSGLIELFGSFAAEFVRSKTPRAALLSTLAGIAIGFISMTFALKMFARPMVALVPLAFLLLTYFSKYRFPKGLPGGFLSVLVGTVIAWTLPFVIDPVWAGPPMSLAAVRESTSTLGVHLPRYAGAGLFELIAQPDLWQGYLTVIVPMGLFNLIGSLQNIESAEAAGDRYHTGLSLAANGSGTIVAAVLGSCFPTTIYIGHPGWKELGAKSNYSVWNGIAIALVCLTGSVTMISRLIPIEAGMAIVLWIGLIITAQAFQTTPKNHAPAVAMGLFPAIAAWGAVILTGTFMIAGGETLEALLRDGDEAARFIDPAVQIQKEAGGFLIHGLIVLERGYIFTCMLLAAMAAELIDRKYLSAAFWAGLAALLTYLGLMHSYQLDGNIVDYYFAPFQDPRGGFLAFNAIGIAFSYALIGLVFLVIEWRTASESTRSPDSQE